VEDDSRTLRRALWATTGAIVVAPIALCLWFEDPLSAAARWRAAAPIFVACLLFASVSQVIRSVRERRFGYPKTRLPAGFMLFRIASLFAVIALTVLTFAAWLVGIAQWQVLLHALLLTLVVSALTSIMGQAMIIVIGFFRAPAAKRY
jgi:hypothetical protein